MTNYTKKITICSEQIKNNKWMPKGAELDVNSRNVTEIFYDKKILFNTKEEADRFIENDYRKKDGYCIEKK